MYKEIGINCEWENDWLNSDLSCLMNENGEYDNKEKDVSEGTQSVNCEGLDKNATVCIEDKEIEEDHIAIERTMLTMGQPLNNMLQFEDIENHMYTCAPGENNTPRYILMDDKFEVLAFPDMFPYGHGGYETSGYRNSKLTLRKYFQQRLLNVDGRFANNVEYLFCAQYATEIKQIKADSNIALRLCKGKTLNGQHITAGMLKILMLLIDLLKLKVHTNSSNMFKVHQHIGNKSYMMFWQCFSH